MFPRLGLIIFFLTITCSSCWKNTTSEKQSYETTSATRALRAALIKVVDYLDCQLYLKNECISKYEAEDQKRKNSTEGTLNLF